jgi:hypothetical protein
MAGMLLRQHARLIGRSVIGQVAAQQHHVGRFRGLRKQRVKRPLRRLFGVDVGYGGDA